MGKFSVEKIRHGGIFHKKYSPLEKFFKGEFFVGETFDSEDGILRKKIPLRGFSGII